MSVSPAKFDDCKEHLERMIKKANRIASPEKTEAQIALETGLMLQGFKEVIDCVNASGGDWKGIPEILTKIGKQTLSPKDFRSLQEADRKFVKDLKGRSVLSESEGFKLVDRSIKKEFKKCHFPDCKKETGLLLCGRCKKVWYCGQEHQRKDRESHKPHCTKPT